MLRATQLRHAAAAVIASCVLCEPPARVALEPVDLGILAVTPRAPCTTPYEGARQ